MHVYVCAAVCEYVYGYLRVGGLVEGLYACLCVFVYVYVCVRMCFLVNFCRTFLDNLYGNTLLERKHNKADIGYVIFPNVFFFYNTLTIAAN